MRSVSSGRHCLRWNTRRHFLCVVNLRAMGHNPHMKTRRIASLQVTEIGIGCNNFGGRIDEAATKAVVDAAIDCGINFFDTADIYGKTVSEEFLGRSLGVRRKDVVIATKFGGFMDGKQTGAHPDHIPKACEASLCRLGTDYIDLYQLHTPDPNVPIADTLGALDSLVKAGKVREIGCSNFDAAMLRDSRSKPGAADFVSVQNHLSLFHRNSQDEVLVECGRLGMAFLPYFPLASGLLTGKYRKNVPHPAGTRIKEDSERLTDTNLEVVEKLIAYAEARGHTILELAFSWLLAHKPIASVIAGATKPEQVRLNAAAAVWEMTSEEMDSVEGLATVEL